MICIKCIREGVEENYSQAVHANGDIEFACPRCGYTFLVKDKDMKKPEEIKE